MMSLPPGSAKVSFPGPSQTTSSYGVPRSSSSATVPTIVAWIPLQVGAAACAGTDRETGIRVRAPIRTPSLMRMMGLTMHHRVGHPAGASTH